MLEHLDTHDGVERPVRLGDLRDVANDVRPRVVPGAHLKPGPVPDAIVLSEILTHVFQVTAAPLVLALARPRVQQAGPGRQLSELPRDPFLSGFSVVRPDPAFDPGPERPLEPRLGELGLKDLA